MFDFQNGYVNILTIKGQYGAYWVIISVRKMWESILGLMAA